MAKNIAYQVRFTGEGYLDDKMKPVATVADLPSEETELVNGMVVTVLNDGEGKPHDYIYNGSTWVRKDTELREYTDAKVSGETERAEAVEALKADKATTLSGYSITDAKIEGNVITLGANSLTAITEHQDISNKADRSNTLSGYGITDAVKTVNSIKPDVSGNVVVKTFATLPSSVITNTTIADFLRTFKDTNPQAGTAYLTNASFSGCPSGMESGGFELYVYVPTSSVFLLEISSTNSFEGHWTDTPGKWMAMYENTTEIMPWKGIMSCPQVNIGENVYKYIPQKDYDGASKYYVDIVVSGKQDSLIVSGDDQNIKTINGESILGKGNITISGGSGSYSAGTGIVINDNTISIDEGVVAKIDDVDSKLAQKQDIENMVTAITSTSTDDEYPTAKAVYNGLNEKITKLGNVDDPSDPGYNQPYHLPYDANFTATTDSIIIGLKTITIDDKNKMVFNKTLSSATESYAGLMSAADKVALGEKANATAVTEALTSAKTYTDQQINAIEIPEYTMATAATESGYSAIYELKKNGTKVGESIKIPSVADAVLSQSLTTDIAVGHVESGTTFNKGTKIEDIIRAIFISELKYGTLNVNLSASGEGSSISDLSNAVISVSGDEITSSSTTGTSASFTIPLNKTCTLYYGNVNGYTTPSSVGNIKFISEGTSAVTGTYVKQVVGQYDYYRMQGLSDKFDEMLEGGQLLTDEEGENVTATSFDSQYILSNFTNGGVASTTEWQLPNLEQSYVISIAVPSPYTIDYIKDVDQYDLDITSDYNLRQTTQINGVEYSLYTYANGSPMAKTNHKIKFK